MSPGCGRRHERLQPLATRSTASVSGDIAQEWHVLLPACHRTDMGEDHEAMGIEHIGRGKDFGQDTVGELAPVGQVELSLSLIHI